jgi:hypothetical protein
MRFRDNFFGTIAGQSINRVPPGIDFIPDGFNGETIKIRGVDAQWWGLKTPEMQLKAYKFCSPLASVIDRLADCDINGKPEILRAQGKGKEDFATNEYAKRMNALLASPNPLQQYLQFRGQQVVYKKLFGFCPVWPIMPAGYTDPSEAYQVWNIPPWLFDFEGTKKLMKQRNIKGMVTHWVLNILGERVEIPADKIFMLEDSYMQDEDRDFLLPISKVVGLDMAVSNICAALEADNVLLKKKGPLGAWTYDPGTDRVAGYIPMTEDKKREVQRDLSSYGLTLDQYQYIVTRQALKWQSTSFDVKQLGTHETLISGTKLICQRYNYSYTLLEESESTFAANGNRASLNLYQNNIIPNRYKDDDKYSLFFKMNENNCKLVSDYSHLPVMQLARKDSADALLAETNLYLKQYESNLITLNTMLTALGYEVRPEGDILYNQTPEYAAQQQATITGNQAGRNA